MTFRLGPRHVVPFLAGALLWLGVLWLAEHHPLVLAFGVAGPLIAAYGVAWLRSLALASSARPDRSRLRSVDGWTTEAPRCVPGPRTSAVSTPSTTTTRGALHAHPGRH